MQKWIDANPDYMENPDKQQYFIDMVRNCGQNIEDIDDKIIKRICSTSYIKDVLNEKLKYYLKRFKNIRISLLVR